MAEKAEQKEQLKRVLKMRDLIAFAIMTMVPIAPMGIYGIVAMLSKGHVPTCYAIGALAMFFTAWGYGQFALRFPEAGSVYAYVRETLGHNVGFIAGWAILLDYVLIPALVILVSALWLEALTGISLVVWATIFIAFATVLNVLGVELTAKTSMALFLFEDFVLVAFVVAAIYKVATTPGLSFNFTPFYNPGEFSWGAVLSGTSVAVLSFLGFDIMTTLAEETIEARKVVSRAVILVIPIIAAMFILQTYLGALVHPGYSFESPDVAFFYIAEEAGGKWLQYLTLLGTVLAWGVGDTLAAQAGISRILFSMGRQGHLPKLFAKVHPKYKTPYVSTIIVALITAPLVYLLTLKDLSSVVNFGALTAFAFMHVALAYRFIKLEKKTLLAIMPFVGFVITAAIWYGLDIYAKELGLVWLVLGIVYLAYITRGFKVKTIIPVE
ncbi:MAG: amino acid permease [Desulfurococcales archaeon]|jgi:amino acid transporter|nr:amino acid permease [Desulfurococcales archaeon]